MLFPSDESRIVFSDECRKMVVDKGYAFPPEEWQEIEEEADRAYSNHDWSKARYGYQFLLHDADVESRRDPETMLRLAECNLELEEYSLCIDLTTNILSQQDHASADKQSGVRYSAYDFRSRAYRKLDQDQLADQDKRAKGNSYH